MGCGQKKLWTKKKITLWMNGKGHADSTQQQQQSAVRTRERELRNRISVGGKKVAQRKTITRKEMPWQLLVKRNMFIKGSRMENTFHPATLRNRLGASRVPSTTQSKRVKRAGKLAAGFGESARRKIHFEGASWNFIYNLFWAFIPVLRWLPVTHNLFSILKSL